MRFTCIQFNLEEEDDYYRYTDVVANGSAIQTEEDLNDPYFDWIKEKDFQWFVEESYEGYLVFTVVFYERHPYFNCFLLRSMRQGNNYIFRNDMMNKPFDVVEPWLLQFYKNYKRRKKNKGTQI